MPLEKQSLEQMIVSAVNQAYATLGASYSSKIKDGGNGVKVDVTTEPGKMDQSFLRALARGIASAIVTHLQANGFIFTSVQTVPATGTGIGSGQIV